MLRLPKSIPIPSRIIGMVDNAQNVPKSAGRKRFRNRRIFVTSTRGLLIIYHPCVDVGPASSHRLREWRLRGLPAIVLLSRVAEGGHGWKLSIISLGLSAVPRRKNGRSLDGADRWCLPTVSCSLRVCWPRIIYIGWPSCLATLLTSKSPCPEAPLVLERKTNIGVSE